MSVRKTVDLFLLIGQSNMAGRGDARRAPVLLPGAGYEFRAVSDPTRLYPITEPFGAAENRGPVDDGASKTGSMATAFVNAYDRVTGVPVVAVSASRGGTDLAFWAENEEVAAEYTARYRAAAVWLAANGFGIRRRFALFCQGETDGDEGTPEETYRVMLDGFLRRRMAEGLGIEKVFVIRIGRYNGLGPRSYRAIRKAQEKVCAEGGMAVLVGTSFAGMKARGLMKDDFHYLQAGYNEQGQEAGKNAALFVTTGRAPALSLSDV